MTTTVADMSLTRLNVHQAPHAAPRPSGQSAWCSARLAASSRRLAQSRQSLRCLRLSAKAHNRHQLTDR
jgi:hypothetical protein